MSLFKRQARRVAALGVGVGLLVLGLEAPALAAEPTVASFSPTSGPATGGCVVVLTGTGFKDFPVTANYTVDFLDPANAATPAADFLPIDATTMWIETPATLAAGTDYTIEVTTHAGGTPAETTGTFLATNGAGGCAPTVASFTPKCGVAGTTVVITGTNLIQSGFVGADVFFNPYAAAQEATHTVPDVDDVTSLSVIVPSGSQDGPISVDTGVTANPVFSTDSFQVPPPDCAPVTTGGHARSVSLTLKRHLVARGTVSLTDSADTTTECFAGVPVKIQRRASGHWKNVGSTTTNDNGVYKKRIKDKAGRYRALAPKVPLTAPDFCSKAKSPTRKHSHR
jgi:IPT/TIG domain-containing protein